jgi:hypothetical protein
MRAYSAFDREFVGAVRVDVHEQHPYGFAGQVHT